MARRRSFRKRCGLTPKVAPNAAARLVGEVPIAAHSSSV